MTQRRQKYHRHELHRPQSHFGNFSWEVKINLKMRQGYVAVTLQPILRLKTLKCIISST